MTDCIREDGDQHLFYNMVKWKTGELYILNGISDHVTLVQPIDTAGNVNNLVSIIGWWIYDSNYKREIHLIKGSLDMIFYQYKDEKGMYDEFKDVYYAVRYVNPK